MRRTTAATRRSCSRRATVNMEGEREERKKQRETRAFFSFSLAGGTRCSFSHPSCSFSFLFFLVQSATGHVSVIRLLLEEGADVDQRNVVRKKEEKKERVLFFYFPFVFFRRRRGSSYFFSTSTLFQKKNSIDARDPADPRRPQRPPRRRLGPALRRRRPQRRRRGGQHPSALGRDARPRRNNLETVKKRQRRRLHKRAGESPGGPVPGVLVPCVEVREGGAGWEGQGKRGHCCSREVRRKKRRKRSFCFLAKIIIKSRLFSLSPPLVL